MRKKILKTLAAGALVAGYATLTAGAQLVTVDYPGDGNGGANATPFEPTINYSSSVTANYGFGSNLEVATNGYYHGYLSAVPRSLNYQFPATLAGSEANGVDYTFTVAPTAGNMLTLTNFDLSNTGFFSATSVGGFALESNVTGTTVLGGSSFAAGSSGTDVSLSTVALKPYFTDVTAPITFEIYVYGVDVDPNSASGHDGGYQQVGLQGVSGNINAGSLSIDGTSSPIPEPGTYALLGIGAAALALSLRQRRSA